MTTTLPVKPMSVNEAWTGRRFKTDAYKSYEREVLWQLPALSIPEGRLAILYEFGLSNSSADADNPVKPLQDILQKRYGFNDSRVFEITIRKTIVPRGSEFLRFTITPFTPGGG